MMVPLMSFKMVVSFLLFRAKEFVVKKYAGLDLQLIQEVLRLIHRNDLQTQGIYGRLGHTRCILFHRRSIKMAALHTCYLKTSLKVGLHVKNAYTEEITSLHPQGL